MLPPGSAARLAELPDQELARVCALRKFAGRFNDCRRLLVLAGVLSTLEGDVVDIGGVVDPANLGQLRALLAQRVALVRQAGMALGRPTAPMTGSTVRALVNRDRSSDVERGSSSSSCSVIVILPGRRTVIFMNSPIKSAEPLRQAPTGCELRDERSLLPWRIVDVAAVKVRALV